MHIPPLASPNPSSQMFLHIHDLILVRVAAFRLVEAGQEPKPATESKQILHAEYHSTH